MGEALHGTADVLEPRRERARVRQGVILAHPDLRERELIKMSALAAALAGTLRERGVPEPEAGLAADAGIAVFRSA